MHPTDQQVNEYIDGTLTNHERSAVEQHLESCGECSKLVAELREACRQAAALEPRQPPERAWAQIEARLRESSSGGWRIVWPALAASVLLLLAVATGLQLRSRPEPAGEPGARELAESAEIELREAEQHYQKAIELLEQIASAESDALDPAIATTLKENLQLIDRAIGESRAALDAQPESDPAQRSLLEGFRMKLVLLQDAVALVNELRKGNG